MTLQYPKGWGASKVYREFRVMNQDVFPLLELSELVACLQSCDFSLATEENISRPTSEYVITLYKQIIDSFMGISPDSLLSTDNAFDTHGATDQQQGTVYGETVKVLALNKICFKFFQDIGVSDFNMMDLYKPDFTRTRRLLSAVVNYARFREERMFDCDKFMSKTEYLLNQLRLKFDDYNYMKQQITGQEQELDLKAGETVESVTEENRHLEQQIVKLRDLQESLNIDYDSYKTSKQAFLQILEKLGYELIELEFERNKLEKHSKTDLEELNGNIKRLSELLTSQRESLNTLEEKQRKLRTSLFTFQELTKEFYDILQLISTDLQESHLREAGLLDMRHQLLQTENKLQNVLSEGIMVKMNILESQLDTHRKKLASLEEEMKSTEKNNKETLLSLQKQYTEEIMPNLQAAEEKVEKEYLTDVIHGYEQQMNDLKIEFQKEADAIDLEYSVLSAHINRYMDTMLKAINETV